MIEYDHAAGNGFCVSCGTVVEENTIVSEIAFGETANGAAIVQGSFVAQGASGFPSWCHSLVKADTVVLAHARMGGPYGNRSSGDSREQTIENGVSFVDILKFVLTYYSNQKDPKHCKCSTLVGSRYFGRKTDVYTCRGTQIYQREKKLECGCRLPLCCMSTERDTQLYAYRFLGPTSSKC